MEREPYCWEIMKEEWVMARCGAVVAFKQGRETIIDRLEKQERKVLKKKRPKKKKKEVPFGIDPIDGLPITRSPDRTPPQSPGVFEGKISPRDPPGSPTSTKNHSDSSGDSNLGTQGCNTGVLPVRRKNSLGYAFVNFTSASAATRIRELLQGYKWGRAQTNCGSFSSSNICEVTYARILENAGKAKNFYKEFSHNDLASCKFPKNENPWGE
ncbi:hypothetical protein LguiB_009871 [Lonicera macranthoides]